MKPISEGTIRVEGKSVHVRETDGRESAAPASRDEPYPTLFCIHGNLGSGRWYEPLLARYPGRAVAPDLPNFGQSDHIDGWSMADYAGWAGAIADALGVTAAVVIGHSLGGAVAMELLCRRPALLSRLVLVDSSPVEGLVTPAAYHPGIEAYKKDKAVLAKALRGMAPTLADEPFFSLLVDDAWKMNRDCFIGHAEALGTADYRMRLEGTRVPVHVLRGDGDPLITAERARDTAAFFGTTVVTFEGCGHSPLVEQPDRFASVIEEIARGGSDA